MRAIHKCASMDCTEPVSRYGDTCGTCRLLSDLDNPAIARADLRSHWAGRLTILPDPDRKTRALRRWWGRWRGVLIIAAIVGGTAYGLLRVDDSRREYEARGPAQVIRVTDHRPGKVTWQAARQTARKPLLPRLAGTEGLE